jgi:hypothetical protein
MVLTLHSRFFSLALCNILIDSILALISCVPCHCAHPRLRADEVQDLLVRALNVDPSQLLTEFLTELGEQRS